MTMNQRNQGQRNTIFVLSLGYSHPFLARSVKHLVVYFYSYVLFHARQTSFNCEIDLAFIFHQIIFFFTEYIDRVQIYSACVPQNQNNQGINSVSYYLCSSKFISCLHYFIIDGMLQCTYCPTLKWSVQYVQRSNPVQ